MKGVPLLLRDAITPWQRTALIPFLPDGISPLHALQGDSTHPQAIGGEGEEWLFLFSSVVSLCIKEKEREEIPVQYAVVPPVDSPYLLTS